MLKLKTGITDRRIVMNPDTGQPAYFRRNPPEVRVVEGFTRRNEMSDQKPPIISEAVRIEIAKLELKPGDKLLVKLDRPVNDAMRKFAKQTIESWAGVDVLIVGPGLELEVVSPQEG